MEKLNPLPKKDIGKTCYSLIREYQPTNCLEFDTLDGSATALTLDALQKNGKTFNFVGYEGDEDLFQATFRNVSKSNGGRFPMILYKEDIIKSTHPIPDELDFVSINTKDKDDIIDWCNKNIFPKCLPGALIAIKNNSKEPLFYVYDQ